MQHLREILEAVQSWIKDTSTVLNDTKDYEYFYGRMDGLVKTKAIILRKLAELEEKGEC